MNRERHDEKLGNIGEALSHYLNRHHTNWRIGCWLKPLCFLEVNHTFHIGHVLENQISNQHKLHESGQNLDTKASKAGTLAKELIFNQSLMQSWFMAFYNPNYFLLKLFGWISELKKVKIFLGGGSIFSWALW